MQAGFTQIPISLVTQTGGNAVMTSLATPQAAGIACSVIGLAYPVYRTYKAIEERNEFERSRWLRYWSVYGAFQIVERTVDSALRWFPLYQHVKLALLMYMALPTFKGSDDMYFKAWQPFLYKYEVKIDTLLAWWDVMVFKAMEPQLQIAASLLAQGAFYCKQFIQWIMTDDKDNTHNDE